MVNEEVELSTRDQVLALVIEHGPLSAGDIARSLDLTPAAVRRHTAHLLESGQIQDHRPSGTAAPRRGRPARHFVATDAAHENLPDTSWELASEALEYLRAVAGEEAVESFLRSRMFRFEERYRARASRLDADEASLEERVQALADVLSEAGFAATVRQVGDGVAVQLCQGHCPVQAVAEAVPELCEVETRAFADLLGIHVQRLATLAAGGHVCTTHVPLGFPAARPAAPTRPTDFTTHPEGRR